VTAQPTLITATDEELREALEAANLPTLLMVMAHLTGDHSWLEEPYRPDRTIALNDNDTAGLSPTRQAEVRSAALEILGKWREGEIPPPPTLTDQQITDMLSVCMGETVPAEFGPMMAEEAGFSERDISWTDGVPTEKLVDFQVLIIGAGISGIGAAIKLRGLKIPYVVIEKNDAVGGTWLENDYPGAGVDTPSHLYEFSFDPSPRWSRYFAKQDEILGYLTDIAQRHEILDSIRFGCEVESADFDVASSVWNVVTRDRAGAAHTYRANVVISSVGQLNRPKYPAITGLDTFPGPVFHSAEWRHDVDLAGKRVAVLGTGASAMQIVPAIAGVPAELVVFQRSPQWAAPNANYQRATAAGTKLLMAQVPYYATWYRMRLLWIFNDKLHPSLTVDPEWPHPERSINAANDKHRAFFTEHIRQQLGDRDDLWDKVLPTYPPYGKRILIDNGWYQAVARDDVNLVADGVVEVDGNAIITADGSRYEVDVLILATGFQNRRFLFPMEVHGADGKSLRDLWGDDDAFAYLGMTVPNFPNFFIMVGPNTALGHGGSLIFVTECEVNYITRLLVTMLEQDIAAIDCRSEVFEAYNDRVDEAHSRMIWTHRGMTNWYRNAAGRVVATTPWRLLDYWKMTHRPTLDDYDVTWRKSLVN
jgi:4-hydroxyacetophenone monooxygenase